MWHAVLHAVEDSIILLPFLFVCYVLIELVEGWTSRKSTRSLKNNGLQVLLGASLGLIPQCGFGVVATDLYAKKRIRMGALIAIYIATSDEAVPVILSHPDKIGSLLPLLLFKFLFAILAGYIVFFIEVLLEKRQIKLTSHEHKSNHNDLQNHTDVENLACESVDELEYNCDNSLEHNHEDSHQESEEHSHSDTAEAENLDSVVHIGCCGHEIEYNENAKMTTKQKLKHYLWHPFMHTIYIFSFIVIVNIVFSIIIHEVGEDSISAFMNQAKFLTPLVALLIGLIPNCASSVILTNLYLLGSLPFGALLSGLIANAGIAILVLFKQNKSIKQNLTILGVCTLTALVAGYALIFIF